MDTKKYELTEQQRNNPQFMIRIIRDNIENIYELGDSLRSNPKFMLRLMREAASTMDTKKIILKRLQIFYDNLPDELKQNAYFIIKSIDEMVSTAADYGNRNKRHLCNTFLKRVIDPTVAIGNKDFWKAIEQRGLMLNEYEYYRDLTVKNLSTRQREYLSKQQDLYEKNIASKREQGQEPDEKTLNEFRTQIPEGLIDRDLHNPELMVELSALDASVLTHVSDELKDNNLFIATAKLRNPEAAKYIDFRGLSQPIVTMYERKRIALEKARQIDETNYKDYLTASDMRDRDFMLDLIRLNPSIYSLAPNAVKDAEFKRKALEANPEVKKYLELEAKKKEEKQKVKTEEREAEYSRQLEELRKEYLELGEKHPYLKLVRRYLASNKTKALFIKENGLLEKEFNAILNEVTSVYPELKEAVNEKNKVTTAIYLNSLDKVIEALVNGDISVKDYAKGNYGNYKVSDILRKTKTSMEQRDYLRQLFAHSIASGELGMMDYIRLFSPKGTFDYSETIVEAKKFLRETERFMPDFNGEDKLFNIAHRMINKLRKYERPFKMSDFLNMKKGFMDPKTGHVEMTTITQEHIDYAKKYLKITDEYMCATTMGEAISKLIRGDITKEEIDRQFEQLTTESSLSKKKAEKDSKNAQLQAISEQIQIQDDKASVVGKILSEHDISTPKSGPSISE